MLFDAVGLDQVAFEVHVEGCGYSGRSGSLQSASRGNGIIRFLAKGGLTGNRGTLTEYVSSAAIRPVAVMFKVAQSVRSPMFASGWFLFKV
jgi:hypothetical protein